MANKVNNSFGGIPTALVSEIFDSSGKIADDIYAPFREINQNRGALRKQLEDKSLIRMNEPSESDEILTSCGIDGSHSLDKFLASDFACCAAFGVEGMVPESGKAHWENPAHKAVFHTVGHNPENERLVYAVMMELQAGLAADTPHDIVFLNGSFVTPFAVFMDSLKYALAAKDTIIGKEFLGRVKPSVMAFRQIFSSNFAGNSGTSGTPGKMWAGIPKSSAKRELSAGLGLPGNYDENTLFTLLLSPCEYTAPASVDQSELHRIKAIPIKDPGFSSVRDSIAAAIGNLRVIHYRPHGWTRVLRIEIDSSVSENPQRLKQLLDTIKFQCGTPGVTEPYPLSSAGNAAQSMTDAIPSMRKMAMSRITSSHKDDPGDIFSLLMGMDSNSG